MIQLDYYLRLLSNLDTNTMMNLAIPHLIAVVGFLTCGMMLYLAILIYRADPKNSKNRFLSFLLAAEGIGAGALNFFGLYPFPIEFLDFLYSVRYVSGSTGMIRIIFYASIVAFYLDSGFLKKIRSLYSSKIIWLTPIIGFLLFVSTVTILGGEIQALGDMYALECTNSDEGNNETYGDSDFMFNTTCPQSLEPVYPLSITKIGIGKLQPILVPATALCLLISTICLYRIDLDAITEDSSFDSREVKAIRFGFLIKLIFLVGATALILIASSMVKGDELDGSDIIQENLFFSLFQSITLFMNIFGSFIMGVLFAYAILKQDVLGIDEQLRKTFTGTIFAGIGAISFIAGTEIMESVAGVGWLGAVIMGSALIVARKPLITSIQSVSNLLLPEVHTKDESAYLELYKLAIKDGNISEKERTMLKLQAQTYGLSEKRVIHLEYWFDNNEESNADNSSSKDNNTNPHDSQTVPNSTQQVPSQSVVAQQWTDETGNNWCRMSDGSTLWWNGKEWQKL